MPIAVHRFAETLRVLLAAPTAAEVNGLWQRERIEEQGWNALAGVERSTDPAVVPVLDETDGLLLRLLDRLPMLAHGRDAVRLRAFRIPALERLQHATAAALVAHRFGTAGLATVATDLRSPVARRYYAFLLLVRLHADPTWPLFRRYLVPEAHHAFLGAATEAARYYPAARPAPVLVELFEVVRSDLHLRAFLAPRLFQSLFVLNDPAAVPLYEDLAAAGHTDADPTRCEVTHALVMLRRLTGTIPANSKFADDGEDARAWIDRAERRFEADRDLVRPVVVL